MNNIENFDEECEIREIVGFCGCGDPEVALEYIRAGLRHIQRYTDPARRNEPAEKYFDDGRALHGSDGAMYFFWYWADKNRLTEHGLSVPGWLEPKGSDLLDRLDAFLGELAELDA